MKIILDLCGGTGSWSKPYREAKDEKGEPIYDIRLITLPDNDVREYEPPENVYGILAAPPCTMFSLARTTAKIPRDLKQGMEIVIVCLNIIWKCRYNNKLKFWALENPTGILRQFLGKPVLTFHPCDFGNNYTKRTDLWGYFSVPMKNKKILTDEEIRLCKTNIRKLPDAICRKLSDRRAITPQGFANAFFKANQ